MHSLEKLSRYDLDLTGWWVKKLNTSLEKEKYINNQGWKAKIWKNKLRTNPTPTHKPSSITKKNNDKIFRVTKICRKKGKFGVLRKSSLFLE